MASEDSADKSRGVTGAETDKRFLVALSYASEKGDYVARVAEILAGRLGRRRILYDKFHEAEFARPRLNPYLPKLYREESALVVVFICKDYVDKEWPGLEWDAVLDIIKKRRGEIMLCSFDEVEVEGLYSNAGFLALEKKTPAETAACILERLAGRRAMPARGGDEDAYPCYQGLLPYGRKNARHFFGRGEEIEEYLSLIADPTRQTLLVKGGSGVGKSSLVLAGVLPRLPNTPPSKPRTSLFLRPLADPIRALAEILNRRLPAAKRRPDAALADYAERLAGDANFLVEQLESGIKAAPRRVLYIDQLEELLVKGHGQDASPQQEARRRQFVEGLRLFLDHDRNNFLVASIRVDYYPLLARDEWRGLADLFRRGVELFLYVPAHDREIDRIVEGPAELAGVRVEAGLLRALRADVKRETSWTPLLSACLQEIVELAQQDERFAAERTLTLKHYHEVGYLGGVIERRAACAMDSLTPQQLRDLSDLWPLLIRLDSSTGAPMRRRFSLHDPSLSPTQYDLINRLIDWRLLANEGEVEIIHDALLTRWAEAKRWIRDHGVDLQELDDFSARAEVWRRLGRPSRKVLSVDEIQAAQALCRRYGSWARLHQGVVALIDHSRAVQSRQELLRALKEGDLDVLERAVAANVRLDRSVLAELDERLQPFYYALYPDEVPREGAVSAVGSAFETAGSHGGAGPAEWRRYFAARLSIAPVGIGRYTLAHLAASAGRLSLLEVLLELGCAVDAPSDHGNSPIVCAASTGHLDTLKWLREHARPGEVDPLLRTDKWGQTPLHFVASGGSTAILDYVLETLPPSVEIDVPTSDGCTVLGRAVMNGHLDFVRRLVQSGRSRPGLMSLQGNGLLHAAVSYGHWRIAEILLAAFSPEDLRLDSTNAEGDTPISLLVGRLQVERDDEVDFGVGILKQLLAAGADANRVVGPGKVPLVCLAVAAGRLSALEALLPKVSLRATDALGLGPLHYALGGRDPSSALALRLLQEPDIRIAERSSDGWSVLKRAVTLGLDEVVKALLARGALSADPAPGDALVARAFHGSEGAANGDRIAQRLLDAGAAQPRFVEVTRDESGRVVGLRGDRLTVSKGLASLAHDPRPFIPAMPGAWTPASADECAALLGDLVSSGRLSPSFLELLSPSRMQSMPLDFYQGGRLFEVPVSLPFADGPAVLTIAACGNRLAVLDGRSEPIHWLNPQALRIRNLTDAIGYLTFFCSMVQGDDGNFRLLGDPRQIPFAGDASEETRARLRGLCQLPAASPSDAKASGAGAGGDTYVLTSRLLYNRALYSASFTVKANGLIEMGTVDDSATEGGLAVLREGFTYGLRAYADAHERWGALPMPSA